MYVGVGVGGTGVGVGGTGVAVGASGVAVGMPASVHGSICGSLCGGVRSRIAVAARWRPDSSLSLLSRPIDFARALCLRDTLTGGQCDPCQKPAHRLGRKGDTNLGRGLD